MILAVGFLTVNDGLAKYLVQTYPVGQVLFLRHLDDHRGGAAASETMMPHADRTPRDGLDLSSGSA